MLSAPAGADRIIVDSITIHSGERDCRYSLPGVATLQDPAASEKVPGNVPGEWRR
jgi:hypothetical protein